MTIVAQNSPLWNTSVKYYAGINLLEVFRISNNYVIRNAGGGIRGKSEKDFLTRDGYQQERNRKAKTMIRELILANNLRYHWTFHYAEEVEDRKRALADFILFIKRLKYAIKVKSLSYVAVLEIQEGRAEKYGAKVIHFHLATDKHIPFEDALKAWGKGGAWVTKHSGDVVKVAGYMGKYISKQTGVLREFNENRYLCSRGLKRAERYQVTISKEEWEDITKDVSTKAYFETGEWIQTTVEKGTMLMKNKNE